MPNNNFSYTQLSFAFLLQKYSYVNHDDTGAFFSFSSSERFLYLSRAFFLPFFFFFFRKILVLFTCFFPKLCFFWQYLLTMFIYMHTKNHKKINWYLGIFSIFFFKIFFIRIFFIRIFTRIFCIRIRRNFSIINNILSNLFFLIRYLHSSKKTLRIITIACSKNYW